MGLKKDTRGSSIIEYVFVMPVVLAVVLAVVQAVIFMNDRAEIQSLARNTADGLARVWYYNPLPLNVLESGTLSVSDRENKQLYGGLKFWETGAKEEAARHYIVARLQHMGYKGGAGALAEGVEVIFNQGVFVSTVEVRIKVPFRLAAGGITGFVGASGGTFVTGVSEKAVVDTPELIRNTDYVAQLIDESPLMAIKEKIITPIRDVLDKILEYFSS